MDREQDTDLDVIVPQAKAAIVEKRSIATFKKEVVEMATLDEDVARGCIYALPREDKQAGETKVIEGASARYAEIVLYAWGNCAAGARTLREDSDYVYAQGFFYDLERNVRVFREVRRRITNRNGHRYSADMIAVTANAAGSIAQRNAVFSGVPKAFWIEGYRRARQVVAGDAETFSSRRSKALDTAQKMGVPKERVFVALGVAGAADIGIDEYVALEGLLTAVRDGEATVDVAFPDPNAKTKGKAGRGMAGLREKIKNEPMTEGKADAASAPVAT